MKMNARERLNDHRPYWKVLVSLIFSLTATFLFIFIGLKGIFYFMPFVIGWFLSFVANPLVIWLERRLKIKKKLGSAIIIILVLTVFVTVIYFAVSRLWSEAVSLSRDIPQMYREIEKGLSVIGERGSEVFNMFPQGIQTGWNAAVENFDTYMGSLIGKISEPTVEAAGNMAMRIPSMLIYTIVTIMSAYFFIADRESVIVWAKKIFPDPIVRRMTMIMDNLKYAVGGYFKAQFKIMGVVFLILLIGFSFFGLRFSIIWALLIAFLDFLPFFGTGTALIPWAVYKFLVGDYKFMIALIVLYGVTQLVRQLIQPKLVGDSIGLSPLFTLVLLFVGYKVGSILGMIFAVPIGMIVVNLYKAGGFDYILDDVRILIEGIMSFRERE